MTGDKKSTIKLYCPSISKTIQWSSCDIEQRIDLGSIERAFGLEAHSLRLNGHLISRGVDEIASSVTWNSLLSFFSARGFSTHPLIVHGKLFRLGSKRVHAPENSEIGAVNTKGYGFACLDRMLSPTDGEVANAKKLKGENNQIDSSLKRRSLPEDQNSLKRTRTNGSISGEDNQTNSSLKRKSLPQDQDSCKRTRTDGTNSVVFERSVNLPSNYKDAYESSGLSCSLISQNMKRAREDEMLLAGPSKILR